MTSGGARQPRSAGGRSGGALLVAAVCALGCGGAAGPPPGPPAVEGPEEAISRIATLWEARYVDKGLRSSPSPVASYERQLVNRLELVHGQSTATESLDFQERFTLRDAREVRCAGRFDSPVSVSYGMRAEEPALELAWPALQHERECDTPGAQIPPSRDQRGGPLRAPFRSARGCRAGPGEAHVSSGRIAASARSGVAWDALCPPP